MRAQHLILPLPMPRRLDEKTRWAIIIESERKPQSDRALARLFGTNHRTVRAILNKYEATGGVADLPRSGRPRKLEEGRVMKMLRRNKKKSRREIARRLAREEGVKVHRTTVGRQARREGWVYRVKKPQPGLQPKDFETRLAFASAPRPRNFWKRVVASDEASITLGWDVRGEWVRKGERPSPRQRRRFMPSVKVWGGSSWEGKTPLYFLPKSMSGKDYLDFIKKEAEPDLLRLYPHERHRPIWLQDREGFHIASVVEKYLQKSSIIPLQHWPSHSPDLNWQENVWELLLQGVRRRMPSTIAGLKKVLREEWEKIDLGQIRKLIASMPRRLEAVIAAGGGNTQY